MDNFVPAIPELLKSLGSDASDAHRAAVAITTTDLVSKEAALQASGAHRGTLRTPLRCTSLWRRLCIRLLCGDAVASDYGKH